MYFLDGQSLKIRGYMVHILLATYNGAEYLEEQLESIVKQTEQEWKLHICDDCSSDNTVEIINKFINLYTGRITLEVNKKNLGVRATFSLLIQKYREPGYYTFCDQDDIWYPQKLEVMLQTMYQEEKKLEGTVLVYSDVSIVDKYGHKKFDSFIKMSKLQIPDRKQMEHLLLYNFVQGASMMWNYNLHCLVKEIPEYALMHDWWLALVAAGQGRIIYIEKTLGAYRQHSENTIGAFDRKKWRCNLIKNALFINWKRICKRNIELKRERICQAQAYMSCFYDKRAELFLEIMGDKIRIRRTLRGITNGYIFLSGFYSIKFYIL